MKKATILRAPIFQPVERVKDAKAIEAHCRANGIRYRLERRTQPPAGFIPQRPHAKAFFVAVIG